jgi:hypothetical protein
MTTAHAAPSGAQTRAISVDQSQARAYCGPAHGRSWTLTRDTTPPGTVELMVGGQQFQYRLVYSPQTRQPARDHLGNYLYMPVA